MPRRILPSRSTMPSFVRVLRSVLALLLLALPLFAQNTPPQKRIAVLNFDSPSVSTDIVGASAEEVGKGASAQLIPKLLAGGKYWILDRDSLQKILKEQAQADTATLDAYALAAKVGRIANLDALIIGAVTRYGLDDTPAPHSSGVHSHNSKAFVQITARVFNISTGEILAEFVADGESDQTGIVTLFSDKKHNSSTQMLDGNFSGALFPQATAHAVDKLAAQLNAFSGKIPALNRAFDGLVAEVSGDTLTINLGKRTGIRPGDQLAVTRNAAAAPTTNVSAPVSIAHSIGVATITEVADDSSTATFVGSTPPQVGDHARSPHESSPPPPH